MVSEKCTFPLSVIIPIHRADIDIGRCIKSLLENPYLNLQVIVAANSDSKSELDRISALIPELPCIEVLHIHKSGKANAINKALHSVKNEYVLIGDADTVFISKGINQCIEKINSDDTIVAITGMVDPIRTNFLTAIQKFEYRRIFTVFKPFWNAMHGILIISGCAGIFKVESLFAVGLYDCSTLGEDFEITMRLHDYHIQHDIPYKIEYIDTPIAETDVPEKLPALAKQRGRWFTGLVDVIWKYKKIILHPVVYQKIVLPYIFSIAFEICGTYMKWILFGIGLAISYITGSFFFYIIIITGTSFVIFEILFNLCVCRRLKIHNIVLIGCLTCLLIALQFFLKDTNVIAILKLKRKKENKWE